MKEDRILKEYERSRKSPRQRERDRERKFRPFAAEIGWIAYEWNRLHEAFAELFDEIIDSKRGGIGFRIWHSVRSDLSQREMLRAAVGGWPRISNAAEESHRDDLVWLINETTRLSHKRNDALHAPFVILAASDEVFVLPLFLLGNPKATRLHGKGDLMKEFKWYRRTAAALADYAEQIVDAMVRPHRGYAWPTRPVLPNRGQAETPKRSRRQTKT